MSCQPVFIQITYITSVTPLNDFILCLNLNDLCDLLVR